MTRSELVRLFALNSICDDYENVDQVILRDVSEDGAKCGLTIDRTEVVKALTGLVEDGLAKAYLLSSHTDSEELPGMPAMDVIEEYFETYFLITKKGIDLHLSEDSWYPLDDDGNLRPDWHLDG